MSKKENETVERKALTFEKHKPASIGQGALGMSFLMQGSDCPRHTTRKMKARLVGEYT